VIHCTVTVEYRIDLNGQPHREVEINQTDLTYGAYERLKATICSAVGEAIEESLHSREGGER